MGKICEIIKIAGKTSSRNIHEPQNRKNWIDNTIMSLIDEKRSAYRKYTQHKGNIALYIEYRAIRNKVTFKIKKHRNEFYKQEFEILGSNTKKQSAFIQQLIDGNGRIGSRLPDNEDDGPSLTHSIDIFVKLAERIMSLVR